MKKPHLLLLTLLGAAAALVPTERDAHAAVMKSWLGSIDSLVGDDTVSGYACMTGNGSPAVTVKVYAGNPATNGVLIADSVASLPSTPAASTACSTTRTNLGFSVTIPPEIKSTYAGSPIYITTGDAPYTTVLAHSGSFSFLPPVWKGGIDSLVGNDTLSGWACQMGSPNSVPVQIYAGDPATTGVLLTDGIASLASEPAIGAACSSTGTALRFSVTIPLEMKSLYEGYPLYMTAGKGTLATVGGPVVLTQSGSFILPTTNGGSWSFDDGAGSVVKGKIDNGTLVNTPTWTTADQCHSGTCLSFPSKAQTPSVDIPYSSSLKFGTGDFTVSAWVKPASGNTGTVMGTVSQCPAKATATLGGWRLSVSSGYARFSMAVGGITSDVRLDDGAWHLLVGRRSGSSISLVVDRGLAATGTILPTYGSDGAGNIVRIGGDAGCAEGVFVGAIDDVRVIGRAMTDTELAISKPQNLSAINLIAMTNGKFVTADPRNNTPMIAAATVANEWETFLFQDLGNGVVALRGSSQKYVQAQNAGSSPLAETNATVIGAWESFKWIDLGDHRFALRSLANNAYVTAENAGASSLIANRSAIGAWETFQWQPAAMLPGVNTSPISIRVTSAPAGTYVSTIPGVPNSGLTAATGLATSSKFRVIDLGSGLVALKAMGTNLYVSVVQSGSDYYLRGNAPSVGPTETFEWVYLGGTGVLGNTQFALRSVSRNLFVTYVQGFFTVFGVGSSTIGPAETFQWSNQVDGADAVAGGGFSFAYDKNYGNNDIGIDMWTLGAATSEAGISGLLSSHAQGSGPGDALRALLPGSSSQVASGFAEVLGDAGININVFSHKVKLLDVRGYADNTLADQLVVTSMGYTIKNLSTSVTFGGSWSIDKTFFEASQQFELGPIPITVTEELTGSLGASWTMTLALASADAVITPSMELDMNVSGGVGTAWASAGVETDLTLLNAQIPLNLGLKNNLLNNQNTITYAASSNLTVTAMEGSVSLYAKVAGKKYSKQIAGWDGEILANKTLFSQSGSLF